MKTAQKSGVKYRRSRRLRTPERAEALGETLQQRRRRVQDELDGIFRHFQKEGQPEIGDAGDRAVQGFDRELCSVRVDQLTRMLRQIDDALVRLEEGRYGRCVTCNAEIPVARLRSLPFALSCRDCQEAAEESRFGLVAPIA